MHWDVHIEAAIAAKANKTSAVMHRVLQGSPITVQTDCYNGMVRPIMEYAATVWDPHRQYLSDSPEKAQRHSARRILHDHSAASSASVIVSRLKLEH